MHCGEFLITLDLKKYQSPTPNEPQSPQTLSPLGFEGLAIQSAVTRLYAPSNALQLKYANLNYQEINTFPHSLNKDFLVVALVHVYTEKKLSPPEVKVTGRDLQLQLEAELASLFSPVFPFVFAYDEEIPYKCFKSNDPV